MADSADLCLLLCLEQLSISLSVLPCHCSLFITAGLFKPPLPDHERHRERGSVERSTSMPAGDRTADSPRKATAAWDGGYTSDEAAQGDTPLPV